MQRWCLIGFLTAAAASVASAEGSPKLQAPVKITLCELVASPEKFQDKIVEVRAVVQTGLQTSLLRDDTCSAFIWLAGIDETPDNAATAVRKTREFQKMLGYLNKRYKPKDGSECVRCSLYKTTVTVVGRFEHVHKGEVDAVSGLPKGFGYLNSYDSQLILQSVSDVVAEPIDRSR